MPCTVCNHPQRRDIDLAILTGSSSFRSLMQQYGPSKSSICRHSKHLVDKLCQSRKDLESSQAQVSLLKLNAFLDHVQRGVEAAAAAGDLDRVFKGSHIGSRIIHQINRMEVPLELSTVYRLISSPGFVSQDSLLPTGPQIITDLHQALVDNAFIPCPDPPPEIAAVDEDNDQDKPEDNEELKNDVPPAAAEDLHPDSLETQNSKLLSTAPRPLTSDHCYSDPSSLIPDPFLSTAHCPLPSAYCLYDLSAAVAVPEKDPKSKRDGSGTLPGQTDPHAKNIHENQQDECYEKNCPKHPNVGGESAPPAILEADALPAAAEAPFPSDSLETGNSKLETTFPETGNQEPETAFEAPAEPDLALLLSNSADDLFEITHGYKRHNPPKHIPNRRREEDCRSPSIFGDPRKLYG